MKVIQIIFLFSFLILTGCSTNSDLLYSVKNPKYYDDMVVSKVISVYDGDTFRADLISPKGIPNIIGKNMGIRLNGIDTPEMRGTSQRLKSIAIKAKNHSTKRLTEANVIILKNVQRGMYFRIVAEVEIDGVSLNQELIDLEYARPYDGGSKRGLWDRRYKKN